MSKRYVLTRQEEMFIDLWRLYRRALRDWWTSSAGLKEALKAFVEKM